MATKASPATTPPYLTFSEEREQRTRVIKFNIDRVQALFNARQHEEAELLAVSALMVQIPELRHRLALNNLLISIYLNQDDKLDLALGAIDEALKIEKNLENRAHLLCSKAAILFKKRDAEGAMRSALVALKLHEKEDALTCDIYHILTAVYFFDSKFPEAKKYARLGLKILDGNQKIKKDLREMLTQMTIKRQGPWRQ